jgi:hypothetical protein
MTYKKNFVLAVKVNGKILRESGEEVQLPFGSEYSVLLKNLNPVRAMAQISIDGKEATTWLILPANGQVEVERFLRSDNLKQGNRFKFIERTQAVEDHRGVQLEDGLIRVEFKKELVFELPKVVEHHTYHHHYPYPWPYYPKPYVPYLAGENSVRAMNSLFVGAMQANLMRSVAENTAGITAPGGLSNQEFVNASGFQTEALEVITLKLIGKHGPVEVKRPVTVDIRTVCQTCGKRSKSGKFCSGCGTSLQII